MSALAAQKSGFVQSDNGWIKFNLADTLNAVDIAEWLTTIPVTSDAESRISQTYAMTLRDIAEKSSEIQQENSDTLEHVLWPVKIADAPLPTFIVPIQARWAQHLFDASLAHQTLFGANPDLALNDEGVYYRKVRNDGGLSAPGRILWYVSQDKGYVGTMQVRACSRLDAVHLGKPKTLFRQFRRLGIYIWDDIYALADRDVNQDIMALRFSDTILFPEPISWANIDQIIRRNAYPFSPLRITLYWTRKVAQRKGVG